jgi:hypothetical protein
MVSLDAGYIREPRRQLGKRKDEADDISREDGGQPTFDASLDHDGSKNISFSSASCHNIIPQ